MKCPNCKYPEFNYDTYEDMYCCKKCGMFYLPKELDKTDNKDAGYLKHARVVEQVNTAGP